MKIEVLTQGNFVQLIDSKSITKFIAKLESDSDTDAKYSLIGINENQGLAYVMVKGRGKVDEKEARTWRLDRLADFLKSHDVQAFEVRNG